MKPQKILCAVDVDRAGVLVEPSSEAALKAVEVAAANHSALRFVHVLDVSEATKEEMLADKLGPAKQHFQKVETVLASLALQAERKGITATHSILFGKPWLRLVEEVLIQDHDLVLLGTARPVSFLKALFGGTCLKMVRKCPCPVWVTKPPDEETSEILVAHCLTEVGNKALAWGSALAQREKAPLRILHVLELEQRAFAPALSATQLQLQIEETKSRLKDELQEISPGHHHDVKYLVEPGTPSAVIHKYLNSNKVRALVMGTVARSGIAGVIAGNTAETLLPWVPCSLLALKPQGFQSPVPVPEGHLQSKSMR